MAVDRRNTVRWQEMEKGIEREEMWNGWRAEGRKQ